MKPDIPYASVFEVFDNVAARVPDQLFLRSPARHRAERTIDDVSFSYADAMAAVRQLRAGYDAAGLSPGDRVALAFDSSVDVYLHLLALNAAGCSAVPLNMAATDVEMLHIIAHSDARYVVAAEEFAARAGTIVANAGDCELVAAAGLAGSGTSSPGTLPADRATEAALLYTSGTTGKPKGCMLSNEYFLTLGHWYASLDGRCRLEPADRLLTPLPPNHMNALCTSFMGMLMSGGCVVQLDRFHPDSWWQTVRDERATIIHYLGVMPAILLRLPESDSDDVSGQVRFGFGAGADPRHHAAFEKRFGFPLVEAWAMTETGAGALTVADREPRHVGERSIGRPVAGMEYRIVDEQDRDVADGVPGELLVRARGDEPRKGFFSGYYMDRQATDAGWLGGWWHTGDVVRSGPDDALYFVDRRKNVIRRSGENIAAVEVEAVLLQHPDVANCAVTAVPDDMRGDEVFAYIVAASGAGDAAEASEINAHCLEHLSYFKVPGYICFVTDLPLTPSQKVARGQVKDNARRAVAESGCHDLRAMKRGGRRARNVQ